MLGRKVTALITLAAWCGLTIGLPVPTRVPAGGSAGKVEAFPCQGHNCGCVTAEMCRRACCCFPKRVEPHRDCCEKPPQHERHGGLRIVSPLKCQGLDGLQLLTHLIVGLPQPNAAPTRDVHAERLKPPVAFAPASRVLEVSPPPPRYPLPLA